MLLESMIYGYFSWVANHLELISSCALAAMLLRLARHGLMVKMRADPEPIWVMGIVAVAFVPMVNVAAIGYQLIVLAMTISCRWADERNED